MAPVMWKWCSSQNIVCSIQTTGVSTSNLQKKYTVLNIEISGPDKSGKCHVKALISKKLRELGLNVVVQSEESYNAPKMVKTEEELIARLKDIEFRVIELQTSI